MNDMFTRIGHLFASAPVKRQTEQTDTRQAIQRHDPEYQRRRQKKDDDQISEFDMEDHADVSVEALQAFLENFVKAQSTEQPEKSNTQDQSNEEQSSAHTQSITQPEPAETPQTINKSPQAARAASIYQRTANSSVQGGKYGPAAQGAETAMGLEAADIRAIYALIEGLKELSARNIYNLQIERSDSFLNSLMNAVEKAKSGPA